MINTNLSKEASFPVPRIPENIVAYLNAVFPEKSATLGDGIDSVMFQGGQRSVVRFLMLIFEEQNDNKLT